ncbi:hypothetical protein [Pedobacter sp. L105]|uniref:hypothetical protein n=1 Tax=Pedobacter sp. L105 TaxID=1641871 RepID=UPI00131AE2B1|nr:hypothetical protein [Pedobacter sp. L105]
MKNIKIKANIFSLLKPLNRSELAKLTGKGGENDPCPSGTTHCYCGSVYKGCLSIQGCINACA